MPFNNYNFFWKKKVEREKLEKQDEIIHELKIMNANLENVERRLTRLEDITI